MTDISSSRRYAQAVFDLAENADDLATWQSDLSVLQQLWADTRSKAYFEDVHVSRLKRVERARTVLGPRLSPLALNLVMLLISRGRTVLIPYIVRQFDDLLRAQHQQVVAQVASAQPLTNEQRAALVRKLEAQSGKSITLDEVVNQELIGGLVLRVGDQLLDLSVAGRLRRLRDQVVGRPS
jgi:F-type H+-transporting ATPase subunit delta